jgi:tRNA nucleotidyltransferase/poly(A) polymerase
MSDTRQHAERAFAELRREPVAQALLAACGATECHLVGGALRDRALGLLTHDLDAIVAGRGRAIAEELAAALPARLVPLGGKEFAAFRLIVIDEPERFVLDIWDRESASLHDDLERRDFTVNSFAVELRGGAVADPFGGLRDLEQGTLRATTRESFAGDPLRVLRLARLLLRLPGFSADPQTFDLARRAAPRLPDAAAERIRDELWLLLSHPEAERGLRTLADLGLYPGLWLGSLGQPSRGAAEKGSPERSAAEGAATQGAAADLAAADIAVLPSCAAELERLLAPDAAPGPGSLTELPTPSAELAAAAWPPVLDLPAARFAATFRHLPAVAESPVATGAGAGSSADHGHVAAGLAHMQQAGYLSTRQAAAIAPLLEEPAELPESELGRRRFIHRHGRHWLTAACSFGGGAAAAGGAALDRWRLAAGPLCELARHEGADLIALPRLLGGDEVQRLLAIGPGPRVGSALAALIAAQVDGMVRSRDEAERFLRKWSAAHAG